MKRTLALLLAAIMCLGMFAGCKGNGDKDPASTDNGTGTTAPVAESYPVGCRLFRIQRKVFSLLCGERL